MTDKAFMPDNLVSNPALTDAMTNLVACLSEINLDANTIAEANALSTASTTTMQADAGVLEQAMAFASIAKARMTASLSKFLGATQGFISSFFETRDVFINLRDKSIVSMLSTGSYVILSDKRIVVPVGFNTTLLKHLEKQIIIASAFDGMVENFLTPLERYIGLMLAEPSALASNRSNDYLGGFKSIHVEKLKELYAKDFSKDRAERRPYGTLIERLGDWPAVIKTYNELVMKMQAVPRSAVQAKLDTIVPLIDLIVQRIEEDPSVYKASGVTTKTLSEFIYNLAQLIEFYSVFNFNLEAIGNTIDCCYDLHKSV
jgi:hypothetical protein